MIPLLTGKTEAELPSALKSDINGKLFGECVKLYFVIKLYNIWKEIMLIRCTRSYGMIYIQKVKFYLSKYY